MPPTFGPVYCETALQWFSFPAEPINFITNAVIVILGLLAFVYARRSRAGADVWALALLLVLTGIGSFLWHGFRTPLTLAFDVIPGLLFLFLFVYAWARRVWSVRAGAAFLGAFVGGTFALSWLTQLLVPFRGPPVGVVVAVIGAASYLIYKVRARGGAVTTLAVMTLVYALIAYFFRSIDLYTCDYLIIGTHFLWHIMLSTAAFYGILLVIELDKTKTPS